MLIIGTMVDYSLLTVSTLDGSYGHNLAGQLFFLKETNNLILLFSSILRVNCGKKATKSESLWQQSPLACMVMDCKGVHHTVHFGSSKNIEAYIQETGCAG